MLSIYEQEVVVFIKFVGEIVIDESGLQMDMFTAFWEEAYTHLFKGATIMVHYQMDMAT